MTDKNKASENADRFERPDVELIWKLTRFLRSYFTPQYYGIDNVPTDHPAFYVTNHTIYGLTDGTLLSVELYKQKGIYLRALVDNFHYKIPLWRDLIEKLGMVRGSRENCARLMEARENILVYPGGAREVCRKKGEAYKLTWKKRLGFARMAIQYAYPIMPVASVGGDETFTIIADSNDILNSKIGKWLLKDTGISEKYFKNGEELPPIAKGLGLSGLPKPVKLYTYFGKPIDTSRFNHQFENEEYLWQLRYETEKAMNELLLELMQIRADDKDVGFWRKIFTKI